MKKAWLVVDMTYDFVADEGALTCGTPGQAAVASLVARLESAYQDGDLIIFANDAHAPNDAEFALWPVHAVAGTSGAELYGELHEFYANHHGENVRYLPKTKYDSFYGTDLEKQLREAGVDEVVVAGVCTSICCYATASGAYYRGFKVRFVPEGMADLTVEAHEFAMRQMQNVLKAEAI